MPDNESQPAPAGSIFGSSLPHNQYLILARTILELYRATGNADYLDKIQKMANTFRAHLRPNAGFPYAYEWNYSDIVTPEDAGRVVSVEDQEHANFVIGCLVDMTHAGIEFSSVDMKRFASTITDVAWNGSSNNFSVGSSIDSSDNPMIPPYFFDWVKLSEFDSRVWPLSYLSIFAATPAGPSQSWDFMTLAELIKWNSVH